MSRCRSQFSFIYLCYSFKSKSKYDNKNARNRHSLHYSVLFFLYLLTDSHVKHHLTIAISLTSRLRDAAGFKDKRLGTDREDCIHLNASVSAAKFYTTPDHLVFEVLDGK